MYTVYLLIYYIHIYIMSVYIFITCIKQNFPKDKVDFNKRLKKNILYVYYTVCLEHAYRKHKIYISTSFQGGVS